LQALVHHGSKVVITQTWGLFSPLGATQEGPKNTTHLRSPMMNITTKKEEEEIKIRTNHDNDHDDR
jgi:hypothetical protein